MKKILLFACSIFVINANAQVEIHDGSYAGPDVSGQSVSYILNPADFTDEFSYWTHKFYVVNSTGSDDTWTVVRRKLNVPAGWTDDICWPADCYTATETEYFEFNGEPTVILTGETVDNAVITIVGNSEYYDAEMKPQIRPNLAAAQTATYRYYVKSQTTQEYVDSVTVELSFPLSVNNAKEAPALSISPNPANDYVNITLDGTESATIHVVDVLGNVVYKTTISEATKINTNDFKSGVYFITIEGANRKAVTKKLVVRH